MNRVGLAGLAVALVLSSSTNSTALAVTAVDAPCLSRSDADDRDVVIEWGGEVDRPIRWGRASLRIDVVLMSKSTDVMLCDPDAWVEIHQIAPVRRLIDAGPIAMVDDGEGRMLHRFEWEIRDRVGAVDAGTYEIAFVSGRESVVEIEGGDRHIVGFAPIVSTRTVTKRPTPKKSLIEGVGRR
ncbi:MAG: hypothetical protein RIS41_2060 [Actinomycetota bacterium]|jgi:hypothetical protein